MIHAFLIRLNILLELANQSVISIYYADESGFSMLPNIPYCYQPKGEQWSVPSVRKKVMNVLGFLNPITNHLVTFPLPEGAYMNSEIFIKFMNEFAAQLTQQTVVILDNASWHKSALTKSMYTEWENQGLHLLFLPPNCPHLNKIETLWRKIKYEWLAIKDFHSKKTLERKLITIFKEYGLNYCIEFSMNFFNDK